MEKIDREINLACWTGAFCILASFFYIFFKITKIQRHGVEGLLDITNLMGAVFIGLVSGTILGFFIWFFCRSLKIKICKLYYVLFAILGLGVGLLAVRLTESTGVFYY
ncbi:hypothetical protein ACFL2G_04750 [Candidatus Omnitrophota bacterium]